MDPQMRETLRKLDELGGWPTNWTEYPIPELRRIFEVERKHWNAGGPTVFSTVDHTLPAAGRRVRVRIYRPSASSPSPAVVLIHGGGWVLGTIESWDRFARAFALASGAVVVSVDYSLSPEWPFSHALDEIVDVVKWLHSMGNVLGIDSTRIGIAGDSAGANLALGTAVALAEQGRSDLLKAALLIYGCYDPAIDSQSYRVYGSGDYRISSDEMRFYWDAYAPRAEDREEARVVPFKGTPAGTPPAVIVVAELDPLHDDSERLAAWYEAHDHRYIFRRYDGLLHGFIHYSRMLDRARSAILEFGSDLSRLLAEDRESGEK
jgi:acetyl esterase